MMAMFLIASAALFFGVLKLLKMQTDENNIVDKNQALANPAEDTEPDDVPPPEPDKKEEPKVAPALPTPPSEQPTLIEPVPVLPEGIEEKLPGTEAMAVLEKFLSAKTLAERMPMIETKSTEAELAASCLAGPLPASPTKFPDYQETNVIEQVVDFYFSVVFQTEKNPQDKHTILVRTRGTGDPKVVVDPFLDLFGGRLAAFVAKPSDKAAVFQVIADPIATCLDPKIPERDKKLTLKLLASDNTKEIAQAFFGRMSEIGQMLEDGTHSLSYGKPKACTVMLSWNTRDDPAYPYLEAIQIKALDWNP